MLKHTVYGLLSVSLIGFTMLTGCGDPGGGTLAVVGDYKISRDEFEKYARGVDRRHSSAEAEFENKRQALDSMIVTRLLIQAAYEKSIDRLEEVARVVLANRDKFLLDAAYARHVSDKVSVSDAEMRDFYSRLEYKIRVSQIMVNDLDTAQMLVERIKGGENFEQLAYEYSMDPAAKRNRGDLGYLVWGAMVDEFQEAVFSMEPGELSPPVKTKYGYHIIKLVDRSPNETRRGFDDMKESIHRSIARKKERALLDDYLDKIAEKYPMTVDRSTCDYIIHKRQQLYPPQILANLPRYDFDLEQLDRNERELIIASWEGGQMSVFEYLTKVRQIPEQFRPALDDYDSLQTMAFLLKRPEILAYEATSEGLENDPQFKEKLNRFKELAMADLMRNDSIPTPPPPDETMAREYYTAHPEEFSNPAKVHVYEILLSDELRAKKLSGEIRSLEAFKENAKELTERPGKRAASGDLGYIERRWSPEIFDAAWKIPLGEIGGPVFTAGKYSIFYVVDRTQAELRDFLGVKRQIMQKLIGEQRMQAWADWVDERKSITDVEVDEDELWETIDMSKYASADTAQASGD